MDENRTPDKISGSGTKVWYDENGKFHNDGYPAIIYTWGTKYWYKHGLRHNENGPAEIYADGSKNWFINDNRLSEREFKQYKIKQFINE